MILRESISVSAGWCSVRESQSFFIRRRSLLDAEQSVQQVSRVCDVCGGEAVVLQELNVLSAAPLFPHAHAERLQQRSARTASVLIQEDLTEQEPAAFRTGFRIPQEIALSY